MKERSKEKRREEGEWWKAGIKGRKKGGKNEGIHPFCTCL